MKEMKVIDKNFDKVIETLEAKEKEIEGLRVSMELLIENKEKLTDKQKFNFN